MKVSVVIPCYNVESCIRVCIESIKKQTLQDFEIICVNDGSSDNTIEVLYEMLSVYPGLKIIDLGQNFGASVARNKGMEYATGDYVQFMDADDQLLPDKLNQQVKLASNNNLPDLIVSGYIYEQGNTSREVRIQPTDVWLMLLKGNLGYTCSNLWRRCKVIEVGGWNPDNKSSQEAELMFRLLKANATLLFDPNINTIKVERKIGSISFSNLARNWKTLTELRVEIYNYLKTSTKLKADYKRSILQIVFDYVRILAKYDLKSASFYYYNVIKKESFKPGLSNSTTVKYLLLLNILGFKLTEKLLNYLRH